MPNKLQAIQFSIPEQEIMKKLTGRQIAIMLENTIDTLGTEMTSKQRKAFAEYFGPSSVTAFLSRD